MIIHTLIDIIHVIKFDAREFDKWNRADKAENELDNAVSLDCRVILPMRNGFSEIISDVMM